MAELDRELLTEAIHSHIRIGRATMPLRIEQRESRGLTMGQLRVMIDIDVEGGLTLGELAQNLGVSPATITGISDRLVRRGLIERRADPGDRRIVRVVLTPAGADAVHQISRAGNRHLANIFRAMGERETRAFIAAATNFVAAAESLNAYGRDGTSAEPAAVDGSSVSAP